MELVSWYSIWGVKHVPKAQSPYRLKEDLSQNLGVEGHQSLRYKADNQSSKFRVVGKLEQKTRKADRSVFHRHGQGQTWQDRFKAGLPHCRSRVAQFHRRPHLLPS